MRAAASTLPPPLSATSNRPSLRPHLLTGRRFWHQTLFCLWSLSRASGRSVAPVIHDDGTLDNEAIHHLKRVFPETRVHSHAEALEKLHAILPQARYPSLNERWSRYPHIRKIINPHLGQGDWKLVLDSDLLFFRTPEFLVDWLDHPDRPLHAVDCEEAYGYPTSSMTELAGAPIAPLVNVGLTGLRGDNIDWDRLEHWTRTLLERHGTSYYLEQALAAMLMAGQRCAIAPATDYITLPLAPEAADCRAVMHHYVADSKRWYFQKNWRRVLSLARS